MLANQFVREYPWRDDGQKQKRIKNNYHYHNNAILFEYAKMNIFF
jgi:hypothetical protein